MATLTANYPTYPNGILQASVNEYSSAYTDRRAFPGKALNNYAFLVDISDRVLTREMAITNVLATAGIGMWSYSVYNQKFHLCPVASGFFGLSGSSAFTLTSLMQKLVEWEQRDLLTVAKNACRTQQSFETILHTGGKTLKITGKLYCSDGIAMKMMGTMVDIS